MSFTGIAFVLGAICGSLAAYLILNGSGYNDEQEDNAQNWAPNVNSNGSIL